MDSLPIEMQIEIFTNLDFKSLKSMHDSSKRHSEIIKQSKKLMKKLQFMIFAGKKDFKLFGYQPDIIYSNLIYEMQDTSPKVKKSIDKFMKNYYKSIQKLTLKNLHRIDAINSLKNYENLTSLTFLNLPYKYNKIPPKCVSLPKLKHLEVINSIEILRILSVHSVKVLKVAHIEELAGSSDSSGDSNNFSNDPNDPNSFESYQHQFNAYFNYFIETCDKLEDLTLTNIRFEPLHDAFGILMENINFKLKRLVLENVNYFEENLINILASQLDSLISLKISSYYPQYDLILFILGALNLQELVIDPRMIPDDFHTYNYSISIKKLVIMDDGLIERNSDEICDRFLPTYRMISSCYGVETLQLYDDSGHEIFKYPTEELLDNLKVLVLNNVPDDFLTLNEFEKLKYLEIDEINSKDDFKNFATVAHCCSNLTTLKINHFPREFFDEWLFYDILLMLWSLEHLHINILYDFSAQFIHRLTTIFYLKKENLRITIIGLEEFEFLSESLAVLKHGITLSFCANPEEFFTKSSEKCVYSGLHKKYNEKHELIEEGKTSLGLN